MKWEVARGSGFRDLGTIAPNPLLEITGLGVRSPKMKIWLCSP